MTSEVTDASLSAEPEFQIGEVAQRTGLTQRTLRFYEERGLVTPADRMEGGFRLYSEADIGRVELIKQLQGLLGFTLAEIKEMVEAEELRAQIRATFRPDRDLLQMDISLSYGIVEYLRILDIVEAHGWPRRQCLPHAGHLFAFNVAAGLRLGGHETAPLGAIPPGLEVSDGHARPGDAPGVGFERDPRFAALFADLTG